MKKHMLVICVAVFAFASTFMLVGCRDRKISETKSTSVSRDGTVTSKEKTVTQAADGTVTKTEESKKITPPDKP